MSESRKRRPRTQLVVRDPPPPDGPLPATVRDQSLPTVVPAVKAMLEDAKVIIATELRTLRINGGLGDSTGQRIRNMVASIASLMESEKKASEGLHGLEGATPAELAAALRAEADRIERGDRDE